MALLDVFADLAELQPEPSTDENSVNSSGAHSYSAREHFHTYLQSLDVERAGLPEDFQAKLSKALAHYGVTELERTPELETAVFRIFLAQQRATADAKIVTTLLRAWLKDLPADETLRQPTGLALERLVAATQVRFPVVSDLARGVVFDWFGQPLLRRSRARVYAAVRNHLRHLDAHPDAADRRRAGRRDGCAAPARWCGWPNQSNTTPRARSETTGKRTGWRRPAARGPGRSAGAASRPAAGPSARPASSVVTILASAVARCWARKIRKTAVLSSGVRSSSVTP